MMSALPRGLSVSRALRGTLVAAVVFWQAASCCCCLGGATTPAMTPYPVSSDPEAQTAMAQQVRDRINEAFSRHPLRSEANAFTIEISDQELTFYVVARLQSGQGEFPARDMQIRFYDGYADVWATFIDIAPTDIPAYVRATVKAVDGQLVFSITQANAGVFPVPGAMRESISKMLSETLAELRLGLEIERVEIVPGRMVLTGYVTGDVPALP